MGMCTGPFSRAIEQFVDLAVSGRFETEDGRCSCHESYAIDRLIQALEEEQPCASELLRAHFESGAWPSTSPTRQYLWLKTSQFGARIGSVDHDEIGQMLARERARLESILPQEQLAQMKW